MKRIQSYLFYQVFRSVVIIVGGLTLLAILAQGLSQTDLIAEHRQSALTFFYVADATGDLRRNHLVAEPAPPGQ